MPDQTTDHLVEAVEASKGAKTATSSPGEFAEIGPFERRQIIEAAAPFLEEKGRSEERERLTNERAVGIVTAAVERFEQEVTKALLSARAHEALGTIDRSIGVRRGFDRLLASLDTDQEAGNG